MTSILVNLKGPVLIGDHVARHCVIFAQDDQRPKTSEQQILAVDEVELHAGSMARRSTSAKRGVKPQGRLVTINLTHSSRQGH